MSELRRVDWHGAVHDYSPEEDAWLHAVAAAGASDEEKATLHLLFAVLDARLK